MENIFNIINIAWFGLGIGSGRTSGYGRYKIIDVKSECDIMKITTSFYVEEYLIKKVQEQAEKENRSFSNLLETILIKYLKQEQTKTEHTTNG